jgi:hypothetical protein
MGTTLDRPLHVHAQHTASSFQREMALPPLRGRRLPTPTRHNVAAREQLRQPSLVRAPNTRWQATPIGRNGFRCGPLLAQQAVVPSSPPHCSRNATLPPFARLALPLRAWNALRQ